ncbi:MAG: acyl carrier protein [Deltaproteobacteria bacterium]|nr:acyl carrier protein [Deltaproteobacteria bacterium]
MEDKLKKIVARVLGLSKNNIGKDTSANTVVGWDSLKQMDLIANIEREFGVEFTDEQIEDMISYDVIRSVLYEIFKKSKM